MCCQPIRVPSDDEIAQSDAECRIPSSHSSSNLSPPNESWTDQAAGDDEERCAGCSSFSTGQSLVTSDGKRGVNYVSTQTPVSENVRRLVRQSCLRSLSVEVSSPLHPAEKGGVAGSGSPSTSTSGTGKPWWIGPSTSSSTRTIVANATLRGTTGDIEGQGVVLFGDEQSGYTLSYTFKLKDTMARGFHRSYSLLLLSADKLLLISHYEYFARGLASIGAKLQSMASDFFALERDMDTDRLLRNATRAAWLPHDFYPKHQFSLDRIRARSLSVITNDSTVFTRLHSMMVELLCSQALLHQDVVLEGVPTQDMLVEMEINGDRERYEAMDCLLATSHNDTLPHVANLRRVASCMRTNDFTALLGHLVVGGQVLVRSDSLLRRRAFLLALAMLLPLGCVKLAINANSYLYSYQCNLLGCACNVSVPEEVQNETFVVLLVEQQQGANNKANSDELDPLNAVSVQVELPSDSVPSRGVPLPTVASRYRQLMSDPIIDDSTLTCAIAATRSEWLDKAKLVFQLRHQKQPVVDMARILRILKCSEADSRVLMFWQSGLSQLYRQAVMNTVRDGAFTSNQQQSGKKIT